MELPEIVVSSVRSGQVVLFLDTEAMLDHQSESFSEDNLRNLLSEHFLNGEYSEESLQWIAELAISETDIGTVQKFIADKYQEAQPANFCLSLPTFRWKSIVTTGFHRLIETTYEKSDNRVQDLVPIISNEDRIDREIKSSNSLMLIKLHGCITRTQDHKLPLILTTDQYSTHIENRNHLFKIFYELCSENAVFFVGNRSRDAGLRSILLQVLKEVKNRPPYYLLKSRISSAERSLWESKGITVIDHDFQEFTKSLEKAIPKNIRPLAQAIQIDHPIQQKFIKNEPVMGSVKDLLTHDVEYVHHNMEIIEGTPKQFYKGFDLGWYPIIKCLDVNRRLLDTVIEDVILRLDNDRLTLSELYVIKAEAGAGKTIFLRKLAWVAATQANVTCLFMKTSGTISFEAIQKLYRLINERIFIFIDAASENISLILLLLSEARRFNVPLTIITAARTNEWNMSCDRLSDYVNKTYPLRYLSEIEISDLVKLLDRHDALGPNLRDKSHEERVKEFGEKAGRQLLVALHEATLGRPFREIIINEYRHIYPQEAQHLYRTVCFINRLNAPVRAGLIARVHNITFDDFREKLFVPLEHVVQTITKSSSDKYYVARHPQIAQIIFEEILLENTDRYNEYIHVLKHLNTSYDSDRDSFRQLIKARVLEETFSAPEDVRAIYDVAIESIGDDAYLYQQMANYQRVIHSDYQLAEDLLNAAQEFDPRDSSIIHSQAELAAARARDAKHPLERRKYRNQAFSLLDNLLKQNKSEQDKYARVTYLKLAIDELRYTLKQEMPTERDIEEAIHNVEKILDTTKQRYPDDTFVNNSEADFAKLIEDNERALLALEAAFKTNSKDRYITMRLSTFYKNKGDLKSAQICLKKSLKSQTFSKELNYEYATILREINPLDIDNITYYFSRSFSAGDGNHLAHFWYARYLFESLDVEKISESEAIFKKLRYEAIRYDVRMKVRDFIKDDLQNRLFSGRVSALQTEHGFVAIDGPGNEIFFHKKDMDKNIWNHLTTGSRISFNIGFTFNGAIAVNI
jgi:cold shock CspA family protein